MDDAKATIGRKLAEVKTFLAQESPPKLSESDTKANFIEPVVAALGWEGIGVVTREYYVKNSQEFIDYVMAGPSGLLLAIEAKPLLTDLTDKHAAQLVQYCVVEGIEWAALTNGRELQFFNTFLNPDLAAKRLLRLDLLAFNNEAEYDALFGQVWQLSRDSMTEPTGIRAWLNQRRVDAALRDILLNPGSSTLRHLRRALSKDEISVTPQELAQWFRGHLNSPNTSLPIPASPSVAQTPTAVSRGRSNTIPVGGSDGDAGAGGMGFLAERSPQVVALYRVLKDAVDRRLPGAKWRTTKSYAVAMEDGRAFLAVRLRTSHLVVGLSVPSSATNPRLERNVGIFTGGTFPMVTRVRNAEDVDDGLLALIGNARDQAMRARRQTIRHGIGLRDLLATGALREGTPLVLLARGNREVARAALAFSGEIIWEGRNYRSPSDRTFASLLGVTSFNGWEYWHAELPERREPLAMIRDRVAGTADEKPGTPPTS